MSNVARAVTDGVAMLPAMAPKLTKWAKEPDVRTLAQDLENTKTSQQAHVANVQRWRDLSKVQGKAKPKKRPGRSSVQPKIIRRQAEWRYSALSEPFLSSQKLFDVTPVTFEDEAAARQNALVLNWQFRTKLNRVKFIDNLVRANVDEGSAIIRLGWKRHTKMVKQTVPVWTYLAPMNQEEVTFFEQAVQAKQDDPRAFEEKAPEEIKAAVEYFEETGQVNVAQLTGEQEVEVEEVILNHPTLDVMNFQNVYIDPSCGDDVDKATFVIVSFETSKAELKKEPKRYKNLDYVNWEAAAVLTAVDHETNTPQTFNFNDQLRKRIVAYEYWGLYDVHGNGELVPIVATWVGDTMIRMEENPFPDGKPPFVVTNYMPVLRSMMGEPDAELLEENQQIIGAVTRGMIDLMGRSANGQQGMAKNMLDVTNRRKFEAGEDYEFNPTMNPAQGLIEHKYPEIPASAINMVMMQNQEAEALTGVKSFSGGLSGEAYGDVAAGIRGALDAASKREMAILRRVADGLVRIGRKIVAMNQVFLSETEIVRVTNEQFVEVKREDLAGDFDLEVDISTAEIDNNKAQDLGFMLQTIGPDMEFGIRQLILVEIARLKRMPHLADQIKKYQPQPDPMAQRMMEIEIALKEKELEKLQSEIELNQAKAESEILKADQQNLDTVEQETGTKHAREMERIQSQAAGNQELEVTKALVKTRKQANGAESKPDIEAAVGYNEISKRSTDGRRGNEALAPDARQIGSFGQRNAVGATVDPRLSVNSMYFDPRLDPALNPASRI